jgi:hypothetical protein
MADLAPAFWLASARLDSVAALPGWLKSVHVQPRWLDEIVTVSIDQTIEAISIAGLDDAVLVSRLENWPKSLQPLLHDACRKTANSEKDLILLVSQSTAGVTAALVSSPVVVGKYNLMPLAYLENRLSFHFPGKEDGLLDSIQIKLQKAERSAAELKLLAFHSPVCKRPVKSETPFTGAAWLSQVAGADRGTLAMGHDLATTLTAKKKHGLIVEIDNDRDLYATWMEAV